MVQFKCIHPLQRKSPAKYMPSIVTVQLGQCGNQAGGSLFDLLSSELHQRKADDETWNEFFRAPLRPDTFPTARAVLIDMEPKVIAQTMKTTTNYQYDPQRQFVKQSGSGNNWAYGFNVHGPTSWEEGIQDILRKEIECCDCFGGFLFMQSLGGGTGSGLGAFVTQKVREEYPNAFIVNQVVWPYSTGEVIVQNYNTLLSVCQLCETSDALLFFENDHLNRVCNQLLSIPHPSFEDLNTVIASQLANILLPSYRADNGRKMNLWLDVIRHLCCHPQYRLLNTIMAPQISQRSKAFSNFLWPGVFRSIHQMLITDAKMDANINWKVNVDGNYAINKSLSNVLITRGTNLDAVQESMISPLRNPAIYAPFQTDPLVVFNDPYPFNGMDKSCCILSNSQSIIQPIDSMLSKASDMFYANAYVYQYEKNGVDADHFQYCFQQLEQVIFNYKSI
jgi:tubulin delta